MLVSLSQRSGSKITLTQHFQADVVVDLIEYRDVTCTGHVPLDNDVGRRQEMKDSLWCCVGVSRGHAKMSHDFVAQHGQKTQDIVAAGLHMRRTNPEYCAWVTVGNISGCDVVCRPPCRLEP